MLEIKEAKYFKPSGFIYDENDNILYYKLVSEDIFGLEIVMQHLAKKVGINRATYDIISNGKKYYYISRDIGMGSTFFTAGDIGIHCNDLLDEVKNKIIHFFDDETLIRDLYKVYFFDILMMNSDRSNGNYGIKTNGRKNNLYILDNEFSFSLLNEVLLNYKIRDNAKEDLKIFLENNPNYKDIFFEMYKKLSPTFLKRVFESVESEYNHRLSKKNILIKKYEQNYEKIGNLFLENVNVLRLKK